MELAVIVVVYNIFCGDSPCCQRLAELFQSPRVLIYDNSDREMGNRDFCEQHRWVYLGGTGNLGLSKAYNAALDRLQADSFSGTVCLLDDDTQITPDYFSTLEQQAALHPEQDIFVPMLRTGGRIVSPQIIPPSQRASFFEDTAACLSYTGPDLYAFNTGMAVRFSVFDDYRYDPALFLDGIDYCFLREMYRRGKRPMVLDCVLEHGFSGLERPEKKKALWRFENYARDYRHVLKDQPKDYDYLVGKRALHLTLQYRTPAFLALFFRLRKHSR